jgi:transposase
VSEIMNPFAGSVVPSADAPQARAGSNQIVRLTTEERAALERWVHRRSTAQALAQRARVVLAFAAGESSTGIAHEVGVSRATVIRLRRRFLERRLEGLRDEPRTGAPRRISDRQIERVLALTLDSAPSSAARWTTRSMAAASGVTQSAVSRIWRAFAIQPHLYERLNHTGDPQFIEKARGIVGIYLHAADRVLALAVEQQTQVPARDPMVTARFAGQMERRAHDYLHQRTTSLFAAVDAASLGVGHTLMQPRHRATAFRQFLNMVDTTVAPELQVHLILDNRAVWKTWLVQRWLKSHTRFHPHAAPMGIPWLTVAEGWVTIMIARHLRAGSAGDARPLIEAMHQHLSTHRERPAPFMWITAAQADRDDANQLLQNF